jgi:ferredoxin
VRITTDLTRCCGSGNCVLIAPAVFDQSQADGTVLVLDAEPQAEHASAVIEAARVCPTQAITVSQARTAEPA